MKIFAQITKVDDEKRMVYGYASTEALDSQGERVSKDAIEAALPEYMRFANIREMHQSSAVGVAKEATIDDKGLYLAVKIVDNSAWEKVKEGVYKGFSIGGRMLEKVGGVIQSLKLSEISLVDRPANPDAVFDVWKSEEMPAQEKAVDDLAALINDGKISPDQVLKLAQAEINKASEMKKYVPLNKGMYTVQMAAQLLDNLSVLQEATEYEANSEGDGSTIPDQLKELCRQMGETLKALVTEEVDELNANVTNEDIAMADKAADIKKSEDMQKMIYEMAKSIDAMRSENVTLSKKVADLEAKPAPPKGVLKVIEKGQDVATDAKEIPSVKKSNGEVDQVSTEIKKVLMGGGRPFIS